MKRNEACEKYDSALQLTNEELRLISRLVYEKFGIKLGEKKRNLIVGRLHKLVTSGGFKSFKEYYNYVVREPSGRALLTMVDQLSTNHTFFFREKDHFDFFFKEALPRLTKKLFKNGRRNIRVWCAGCSSGEEPYTLAMLLREYFGVHISNMDIGILATDISISVLKKALAGIYPAETISQVPLSFRRKYFTPLKDGNWMINQELKEMVLFRRLNLIRNEYPFKGRFHAIFCRNVMIYFDSATQKALVERFYRYTEPGGYFFVGHSESLSRLSVQYKYIRPSIYHKEK